MPAAAVTFFDGDEAGLAVAKPSHLPFRQFIMIRSLVVALALLAFATRLVAAEPTVSVGVDYGDGSEKRFSAIAWQEGTTVLEALQSAAKHPRGPTFKHRGSGATAFVSQIDDVANAGGGGKNWRFHVNGKLADQGCGVFPLKAGDAVLWKFEKGN